MLLSGEQGNTEARFSRTVTSGPYYLDGLSLVPSSLLFSCGLTVERTTMILFKISNQNGAPRDTAIAVRRKPGNPFRNSTNPLRVGGHVPFQPIGMPSLSRCST